jgi:choline transport protein
MDMEKKATGSPVLEGDDSIEVGEVLNASGHKQELERQFSLLSVCSIGITTGNVWAALGGSIVSFHTLFQPTDLVGKGTRFMMAILII